MNEGPILESLTRRLAECPADFLAEPRLGATGVVHVDAVVNDILQAVGHAPLTAAQLQAFRGGSKQAKSLRRQLRLQLLAAWLLHDDWFRSKGLGELGHVFLTGEALKELGRSVDAPAVVSDPDRREELARLCLSALGLRPAGESDAEAHDRLLAISTAERERVIAAARAAEERAQQIRAEMARKAAEEAADKWSRE